MEKSDISIFVSIIALAISVWSLYLQRKKGRLVIRFLGRMYQVVIEVVNVGENPVMISEISVGLTFGKMNFCEIKSADMPAQIMKLEPRGGMLRLDDFSESIQAVLDEFFPGQDSVEANVNVYIRTSLGDTYFRVCKTPIDLVESVQFSKHN
jgi:hypothetical protein